MRSNRRWSHRAQLVHTDLRWRSGQHLRQCAGRQDSALLERTGFGGHRLSSGQLPGVQMRRSNRSNALRDRTRKNGILCRTNLRRWPTGNGGHLPVATRNRSHGAGWRSGEFGVALDRRHRSPKFLRCRVYLRQRVTQVLVTAPMPSACSTVSVPMPLSEQDNRSPRSCESLKVSRYFVLLPTTCESTCASSTAWQPTN